MFSEDVIARVRESVDIVDFISGYVALKKRGRNFVGLCPFHSEKTPSFNVNPEKQIFHCFGCGVGGNVFKFLELQEGTPFPEAVRTLAARGGITLPDSRTSAQDRKTEDEKRLLLALTAEAAEYFGRELAGPLGSAAREYLERRGVSRGIVKEFGIGFARPEWDGLLSHLKQKGRQPAIIEKAGLAIKRSEGEGYYDRFRGRIIFPIRDLTGQVIAFGGRVMDDSLPKYLNSPETPLYNKSQVLFCLDRAKEEARKLGYFIIVEGYLDAIACHQAGINNAVATLGTALTEAHVRLLRRFAQKLVMIFDPDPAGVKAVMRGFDLFAGSGMKVNVVSLPGGDDPDTFLKKQGRDAFTACLRQSVKFMDFMLSQVVGDRRSAGIDEKVEKAGEMLTLIAKLPSGIERDYYLKRTAESLDVAEPVLRQEMAERHQAPTGPRERSAAPPPVSARPKAEEILIHLMLRDHEAARKIRQEIAPEDFTDPLFRRAAQAFFAALDQGRPIEEQTLAAADDEELQRLITRYAVLDTEYHDPEKTRLDCVARIRRQNHEAALKTIARAIKEAEDRGDSAELARLLERQRSMTKRNEGAGVKDG